MVAAQDGPHRDRVDGMPQVRQGTLDPAIAPARVAGNLRCSQEADCPALCRCKTACDRLRLEGQAARWTMAQDLVVLSRECEGSHQVVIADAVSDRAEVMLHVVSERTRLPDQPGDALPSRGVAPLARSRLAGVFRARLVSCRRAHAVRPLVLIRLAARLLPRHRRLTPTARHIPCRKMCSSSQRATSAH
jgi:hypothetical protein